MNWFAMISLTPMIAAEFDGGPQSTLIHEDQNVGVIFRRNATDVTESARQIHMNVGVCHPCSAEFHLSHHHGAIVRSLFEPFTELKRPAPAFVGLPVKGTNKFLRKVKIEALQRVRALEEIEICVDLARDVSTRFIKFLGIVKQRVLDHTVARQKRGVNWSRPRLRRTETLRAPVLNGVVWNACIRGDSKRSLHSLPTNRSQDAIGSEWWPA
jgi:hypothetical protein